MTEINKSLRLNMMLNAIKGLLSVLFPLITFPYISNVLGVDNIGRYNFSSSIISYFVLLAGLGINTYAIREGARIRQNKKQIQNFVNEIFSINIISTIISYCLFFLILFLVEKLHEYNSLLLIFSIQIAFTTIGVEWIYSIYEDYFYITIRSILFQIISLILLFVFVKDENDVCIYAAITVLSSVGSNLINFIRARKYCNICFIKNFNLKEHLKPIMILFGMSATISIYVSSDMTILGFLCNDYTVGIYAVSMKVYNVVKTILSAILIVSVPRLSSLLANSDKNKFSIVASDIYNTLVSVVLPSMVGVILLRYQIVVFLSGTDYAEATSSLFLLSIALIFCMGAWFWGQCILVPMKMEGTVFKVTVVSALVNVGLNMVLIPIWKENAAALTTIIAEGISFVWCWYKGRKYTKVTGTISTLLKVIVGCVGIIAVSIICGKLFGNGVTYMFSTIIGAVIIYAVIEIVLKNQAVWSIVESGKKKLHI